MNFQGQLQKLRTQRNMTQKELATQLNIKQQAVSQYETGTSLPKIDVILKMSQIFNVSIAYLIGITEDTNNVDLPDDVIKLLEIYDSLPIDRKNISIELLKVLKNTSEKEV